MVLRPKTFVSRPRSWGFEFQGQGFGFQGQGFENRLPLEKLRISKLNQEPNRTLKNCSIKQHGGYQYQDNGGILQPFISYFIFCLIKKMVQLNCIKTMKNGQQWATRLTMFDLVVYRRALGTEPILYTRRRWALSLAQHKGKDSTLSLHKMFIDLDNPSATVYTRYIIELIWTNHSAEQFL